MHIDIALHNPALPAYSVACLVLCANLIFLWAYSGAVRGKTKTAMNQEDSELYGAALAENDPPAVARVLRAHDNAQANIYPFLFLGLVFVLNGGSATAAEITFGIFTVARIGHSFAYLSGKQPWRSISFIVGGLAIIALMVEIVCLLLK
jgi:microsomal prostaglandin-E synthase 1